MELSQLVDTSLVSFLSKLSAMHTRTADAVVCGAGVIGLSSALHLAERGLRVALVDSRPPMSLTSIRSTECYRDLWEHPAMASFMRRSIDGLGRRLAAHPGAFAMHPRGYLWVTHDARLATDVFGAIASQFHDAGEPVRRIGGDGDDRAPPDGLDVRGLDVYTGAAARTRFPFLAPTVCAAVHARRCGWLDSQQLGAHLWALARDKGVQLLTGQVTAVDTSGGSVRRVTVGPTRTSNTPVDRPSHPLVIDTPVLVNAAGPFAAAVGQLVGDTLPIHNEVHAKAILRDTRNVVPTGGTSNSNTESRTHRSTGAFPAASAVKR